MVLAKLLKNIFKSQKSHVPTVQCWGVGGGGDGRWLVCSLSSPPPPRCRPPLTSTVHHPPARVRVRMGTGTDALARKGWLQEQTHWWHGDRRRTQEPSPLGPLASHQPSDHNDFADVPQGRGELSRFKHIAASIWWILEQNTSCRLTKI